MLEIAMTANRGLEIAADVRQSLIERRAQLFIWWESAAVELLAIVAIKRHPRKTTGGIRICVGRPHVVSHENIIHCVTVIEAWCREQGATGMRMDSRDGWERVLRRLGYERTHVVLEKDL